MKIGKKSFMNRGGIIDHNSRSYKRSLKFFQWNAELRGRISDFYEATADL
ncbi:MULTISPECIES: hypothetical protein [Bacillus]|nr:MULTISPECIES: hypothetical protein [Bacillus]